MKKKLFLAAAALSMLMASCNSDRIYVDRVSLEPEMVWDMDNILEFEADVQDPSQLYDLMVELRTVDYYPTANMWLYINTVAPSGTVQKDTVELILRDEKGFSTSNRMCFGELEDYELPFHKAVRFPSAGKYKFQIQHGMRMEKLPFVNEVGLSIHKHRD